ncbi:MAG: hypothetical protein KTR31_32275 [Myxococcales bacterium]|nr:hypothetical protein [Myxococcales bacterium]
MRARVCVIPPDGTEVWLHPGDLVGRSHAAALQLQDMRVSEAHAMVSLRGGQLKLLALRGRLATDGSPVSEVALQAGQTVRLASGVSLGINHVELPDHVLAVQGDDLPHTPLMQHSASLLTHPAPALRKGYVDDAPAYLWSDGEGFWLRVGEDSPVKLEAGTQWQLGPRSFEAVAVPLQRLAAPSTRGPGRLHAPLRIVAHFDTAAIHRPGEPALGLGGTSARILSELVALDGPASWSTIARQLWRDVPEELHLRRRWDKNLARLRQKLRQAGIRPDLIRSDGSGQCELLLYEGDETVDHT